MSPTHSILAPSSANIWVPCPGSVRMTADLPDEETEAAREGTLAHEQAASVLMDQLEATDEHVQFYVDHIRKTAQGGSVYVENTIGIPGIHPGCHGTPDVYFLTDAETLHVADFKYGFGPVSAYENWQMICYACGLLDMYPQITRVHFHIVQPRVFGEKVRHWACNTEVLNDYIERVKASAASAMSPSALCNPGLWCRYCKARGICRALRDTTGKVLDTTYLPITYELERSDLGGELQMLKRGIKLIEYRIAALEEQAIKALDSGQPVPGFGLKPSVGRMRWNKTVDEVKALGDMFGISLGKDATVTPAQAVKAGIPESIVKTYADRPSNGVKLVEVDGSEIFNGGN